MQQAKPDALPEDHLIVREITHRINNELASTIGAVSSVALRCSNPEVKVVLGTIIDRLHNFAHLHRALQMPTHDANIDASAYVRQLCLSISKSKLDAGGIRLVYEEMPLRLNAMRCWKLGMIISELITNAARHAFRERGGTIRVELACRGAFVECSVADDGCSRVPVTPGHGTNILRALARELEADFFQTFTPIGATSTLLFPKNP